MANILQISFQFVAAVGEASLAYNITLLTAS